jgi:hypothetical protein
VLFRPSPAGTIEVAEPAALVGEVEVEPGQPGALQGLEID